MEKITEKIAALPPGGKYFSLEFFPPKTPMGFANLQARLERMASALRPLFINVTWGAGGSTASKSLELAELCQRQLGMTTCLHLTCTNMSRSLVDDALEQAKAVGIRNILALRGDPPRHEEYRDDWGKDGETENGEGNGSEWEFTWAVDLVRYIRKQYGDYFCIGVAAYPEGHHDRSHPEEQSPQFDMPYLVEKTNAGVDFIMTQLFYDVEAFLKFEALLRSHESGLFKTIPIIPGLMPIQSYQILKRTTKLSHAKVPPDIMDRLERARGDDEAVKSVGIDILGEIVDRIVNSPSPNGHRGVHLYTLNLEKVVAHILERCKLIPASPSPTPNPNDPTSAIDDSDDFTVREIAEQSSQRRRLSSVNSGPRNRVVVERSSGSSKANFEVSEDEAGVPREPVDTRATALAISEGEGTLGREATWDDYPNGRWGDARSPAFGEIDGYGPSLHVSIPQAVKLWGYPVTEEDISHIFRRHIRGEIDALPWSEEGLNPETNTIIKELEKLIDKGWWTVASQPAVNGLKSTDSVFGWGPKSGFIFQKPFVELFLPSRSWATLEPILRSDPDVTFFAGNAAGASSSSDEDSINPVTWGSFAGKEIITPTIIEAVSFRAWRDEAFSIWAEWRRIYPPRGETAKLLDRTRNDYWLVNIIHHRFVEADALWKMLEEVQ